MIAMGTNFFHRFTNLLFLFLLSVIFVSGEISSFETAAIKRIEESGLKLEEDRFVMDPIFIQREDRSTSQTRYILPEGLEFEYVTHRNDSNRKVIVFTSEEDDLVFKRKKRVYIALRKSSLPVNDKRYPEYYAAAVYIRDAGKTDDKTYEIEGKQYKIEWDFWDDHFVPGGRSLALYARFCSTVFIVTCLFPDELPRAGVNGIVKPPKRYISKANYVEEFNETFVIAGEADPEDVYDLYRDLETPKAMMGRSVKDDPSPVDPGNLPAKYSPERLDELCKVLYPDGKKPKVCTQRRKRSSEATTALDFPGWKTQYIKAVKGSYMAHEDLPHFGFGNCPFKPWKADDLKNLKDATEGLEFYLTALRSECVSLLRTILADAIEDGTIIFDGAKTFQLNSTLKNLEIVKFRRREYILISHTVGFALFSQALENAIKNPVEHPELPDGRKISRGVQMSMTWALNYYYAARLLCRYHMIAGGRHAQIALRMIISKLAQDKQNIENQCNDCEEDLAINYNDRLAIFSLLEYAKYGLNEADTKGTNPHVEFKEFYKNNIKLNEMRVNRYT